MGIRNINISDQRFGRLLAIEKLRKDKKNQWVWQFKCDCGNFTESCPYIVRSGKKRSCGCLHKEGLIDLNKKLKKTHGMKKTRIYNIWNGILDRCNNKNSRDYKNWGGRGIKCLWKSFEQFRDDMYESYIKHVENFGENQTSIDRIDNNKNYCRENCKWSTMKEQCNNRRKRKIYSSLSENPDLS